MGRASYCALSHIPIDTNEKCVLIPIKKEFEYDWCNNYIPMSLPIVGYYNDDLGSIVKIERDSNVEMLEEYFKHPIEEILEYITLKEHGSVEINNPELNVASYVLIDYDVYHSVDKVNDSSLIKVDTFNAINTHLFKNKVGLFESSKHLFSKLFEEGLINKIPNDYTLFNEIGYFKVSMFSDMYLLPYDKFKDDMLKLWNVIMCMLVLGKKLEPHINDTLQCPLHSDVVNMYEKFLKIAKQKQEKEIQELIKLGRYYAD